MVIRISLCGYRTGIMEVEGSGGGGGACVCVVLVEILSQAIAKAPASAVSQDGQEPSGRDPALRRSVRAMAEELWRMVLPSMWQGSDGLARPFRQPCQVRSEVRRRLSLLWHGRGFL